MEVSYKRKKEIALVPSPDYESFEKWSAFRGRSGLMLLWAFWMRWLRELRVSHRCKLSTCSWLCLMYLYCSHQTQYIFHIQPDFTFLYSSQHSCPASFCASFTVTMLEWTLVEITLLICIIPVSLTRVQSCNYSADLFLNYILDLFSNSHTMVRCANTTFLVITVTFVSRTLGTRF